MIYQKYKKMVESFQEEMFCFEILKHQVVWISRLNTILDFVIEPPVLEMYGYLN